jgi:uracil-DNA glycosylase
VVALGKIAFDSCLNYLKRNRVITSRAGYVFGHGAEYTMPNSITLLASYHPSNQNTATGKLTAKMFEDIFRRASEIVASV